MKNENLFKAIKNTKELINKKLYFYKKKNMYFELVSTTCKSTIDKVSIDYLFMQVSKSVTEDRKDYNSLSDIIEAIEEDNNSLYVLYPENELYKMIYSSIHMETKDSVTYVKISLDLKKVWESQ